MDCPRIGPWVFFIVYTAGMLGFWLLGVARRVKHADDFCRGRRAVSYGPYKHYP